ncbi:hypothetical protein KI387_010597, partial [Taxus chinensis]
GDDGTKLDINIQPIVQEFMDVFPEEIEELPPRRIVEHTIDLIPGVEPVSKSPYRQLIPELAEI